jgi:hypothetical protein
MQRMAKPDPREEAIQEVQIGYLHYTDTVIGVQFEIRTVGFELYYPLFIELEFIYDFSGLQMAVTSGTFHKVGLYSSSVCIIDHTSYRNM